MARQGLKVSSQTFWDQLDRLGDHIQATYEGIGKWIRGGDVMGMDETPWPHIKKAAPKVATLGAPRPRRRLVCPAKLTEWGK
jgi:hypothetical protein